MTKKSSKDNIKTSKWIPQSGISPWLSVTVAIGLFLSYQFHLIPETQLSAAALALLIAYVIFSVPIITRNDIQINEIVQQNDAMIDKIMSIGAGVTVIKDTGAFYRQLISIITENSKVDVTYFTPNVPSEFSDENSNLYWETINRYLIQKTAFRLRRISTVETLQKLRWLLNTITVAKNPPGYHLHYLDTSYCHTPLNVNIIDEEHVFVFGPEERSRSTEYMYIRDKNVANSMQRYFDYLWDNTPVLGESGRLDSKAITKLKQKFGIADGSPCPIGVFDSGIGGLSVVKEIRILLPNEDIVYVADQANIPYGERSIEDVREFSHAVVRFLMNLEVKLIVIACNTATAASLEWLRKQFPHFEFVGVVPAVKTAAETRKKRKICVLATPATFSTQYFESLLSEHAKNAEVIKVELPMVVDAVERGNIRNHSTKKLLQDSIEPVIQDVEAVVLGCTHFVFVKDIIQNIVGSNIEVIEASEAIARQVSNVLQKKGLAKVTDESIDGKLNIYTSGPPNEFARVIRQLGVEANQINGIQWNDGKLQHL